MIVPIILKVRIRREADYVHLYGAILILQAALQTPIKLGQERQHRILVGSKVLDTFNRYSDYEHKRYGVGLRSDHTNPKLKTVEH